MGHSLNPKTGSYFLPVPNHRSTYLSSVLMVGANRLVLNVSSIENELLVSLPSKNSTSTPPDVIQEWLRQHRPKVQSSAN
jgi:hypothetical protein